MKKPTENIRHQLLKYLVDRANRTPSTTTAPPQYMANPSASLRIPVMYTPAYPDEADDWEEPTEPSLAAINITIDNSITIIGDKNSVTTNPSKATDAEHDHQQMSNLALTVVNALKVHSLTQEGGRERPITIQLKRGVTIHGADNRVALAYPGGSSTLAHCEDGDRSRSVSGTSLDSLKDEDDVGETGQPLKKRARY